MDSAQAEGMNGPRRIEISTPEDERRERDAEVAECPFVPGTDEPEATGGPAPAEQEAAADTEAPSAEEEMAKLQEILVDLEQKCTYAEDQHLRVVAELQNYKRRMQQERDQLVRLAAEGLVTELIPVLDNFERALQVKVDSPGAECLMAGVRMIYDQVQSVLAGHGVERIDALAQDFDPHLHDAIEREETMALPPGVVVAELAKGYRLHGRLLRPVRVRVTVRPQGREEEPRDAEA